MTDPTREKPKMKLRTRTFFYSVLVDHQGIRVRCAYCGDVLFTQQEPLNDTNVPDFSAGINAHACFQENAQPPCPQVKS